jgi:hypothetical protein
MINFIRNAFEQYMFADVVHFSVAAKMKTFLVHCVYMFRVKLH